MDPQPPDADLLEGLRVEFGDDGRRAGEFLRTGYELLHLSGEAFPRVGAAVAYCLREAMTSVLESVAVQRPATRAEILRSILEARTSYERAASLPGEDAEGALAELLARIRELDDIPAQQRFHQQRLTAIVLDHTGAEPLSSGTRPVLAYPGLLDRLNGALHGSRSGVDAVGLWSECIGLMRQLFIAPDIRNAELERLARIESPTPEDRDAACRLLVTPQHVRFFLRKATDPGWLDVLASTGVLDPPDSGTAWPVFPGLVGLAEDHHAEVTAWLEQMYATHGAKPMSACDIAYAALEIGGPALSLVLRAVRDHPRHGDIVMFGDMAVEKLDAADELVESFADILLNGDSFSAMGYAKPLMGQLSGGVSEGNACGRVRLLCHKMRSVTEDSWRLHNLSWDSSGSVTDHDEFVGEDRFAALLRCLVDALEKAWTWVPLGELLDLLEDLPAAILQRLRTWALGHAPNVDPALLVVEVEQAVSSRKPTGDDLALIDRAVNECEASVYTACWRDALGSAPTVEEAGRARADDTVPSEWHRVLRWVSLLPDEVTDEWAEPCEIITAPYGLPGRESLEHRTRVRGGFERSPFSPEQLQSMDPHSVADMISQWRPGPDDWLVTAHALARTLGSVVKDDPSRWLASPVRIVTRLHHPTYIREYLRAVADVASDHELPIEQLLDAIRLIRTNPWSPTAIGDRGDYDPDWSSAQLSAIDLIGAIVRSGSPLGNSSDDVWAILEAETMSCSTASQADTGNREDLHGDLQVDPDGTFRLQRDTSNEEDPYQRAINRPRTRALEVVMSLIANEHRDTGAVRPEAVRLLDASLRLTGRDGAEHRAVIGSRIGFLRHVLEDWTEDNRELLFGNQAPNGLGQLTADQAIKWSSHPNEWLLENFRSRVRSAVERQVDNALKQLLVAMLWEIPGYSVETNANFLLGSPKLASRSGEALGRLLQNAEPEQRYLEIVAEFWRAMLQQAPAGAMLGFGWLSMVDAMDFDLWADLTLETLRSNGGRIDWSHGVAERVAASPPSRTGLAIMDTMVRAQNDPWGSRRVIDEARKILASSQALATTDEYRRLHNTLLERGAIE